MSLQASDEDAAQWRSEASSAVEQHHVAAAAEQRATAAEAELTETRQQAAAAGAELQAMEEAFTELQAKVQRLRTPKSVISTLWHAVCQLAAMEETFIALQAKVGRVGFRLMSRDNATDSQL